VNRQQPTLGMAAGRRVRVARQRPRWDVLAVVAAGGAFGAIARQIVSDVLPGASGGFPLATFVVNVSGCLLIGVLMVSIVEVRRLHRLARPLLGVGLLGGYTTFSTYMVETQRLLQAGDPAVAFAYVGGTVVTALLAVQAGILFARWFLRVLHHRRV